MKIFRVIILVLLIGLGISSGLAKIMLIPEEMEFFKGVGFSETLLVLFGVTQLIGGILLLFKKLRKLGACILAITFGASTVFIFLSGNIAFGLFSILPILLTGIIIIESTTEFAHGKSS